MAGPVVILHVGVPKSGTTFLQNALAEHGEALRARGVLYPQTPDDVMFRAALDVRGNHKAWGRRRQEVQGSWDRLCRQARAHDGVTVLSHELLGGAGPSQVDSALSMLRGLEVHVVVTARDPARQLTSEWQEGIKHGRRATFAEFHSRVDASLPDDDLARRFHAAQDLPDVLGRWSRGVPRDRVHLVIGGPDGDPSDDLWRQFAQAAGFDPATLELPAGSRTNTSLAAEETDLLRRVNVALDGRLPQPHYGNLVKHRVVRDVLAARGGRRPMAPPSAHDEAVVLGEQWAKEVQRAGWSVHGDLAHLVPGPHLPGGLHPDTVQPGRQVDAAVEVIADLLLRLHTSESDLVHQRTKRRSWKQQTKTLRRRLAELDT